MHWHKYTGSLYTTSLAEHALAQIIHIILHSTRIAHVHYHLAQDQHSTYTRTESGFISCRPRFIFHSTIDIFGSKIKTWTVAMKISFRIDHLGQYEGGNPFSNLDHCILVNGICHHFKILCNCSVKCFQSLRTRHK